MEYFDAEYAVESIREKYNKEHGIKECKVEDDYTKRKRFEKQVYRLLIMHNVPYSKKDEKKTFEEYLLSDDENTSKTKGAKLKHSTKAKRRNNHNAGKEHEMKEEEDVDERIASIKNKMRQKKRPTTERQQKRREAKKLKRSKGVQKLLQSSAKIMKNENIKQNKLKNGVIKTVSNKDGEEEPDSKSKIQPIQQKPVFNEESKIVYSKIDFAATPGAKTKKSHKNPKEILKELKQTSQQINELKEQGQSDKAAELQNSIAWKKAFDKIEGKKVKDDTKLLQKAIKKKKVEKRAAKKKWEERKQKVDHDIAKRQKKRQENLDKRSKDKKNKKLKKASKKGRIIPGY
ncbi:surfeit locus protein 6 homolog [Drosophila mojavensis]|uniref:Ribosomal RNA-processing protein 14/surfeit locus protein 6 C-terminal domain-containing protein n=1 Tax=Drosophila mojavensis TaxID=7230 RepID=B4K4R5_DROMO|nr:surfeit locus protein 6 homolog [Drosophila mojavensis]EDW16068.1 uncharacterized protein Dmoj_GI10326 [Drosophila mojavensis]